MNGVEPLPSAWARALMPSAILRTLAGGPRHGYAIAKRLGELGFGTPKGGSLYPVLARLEEEGAVRTAWVEGAHGPARKEYKITATGLVRLHGEAARLSHVATMLAEEE